MGGKENISKLSKIKILGLIREYGTISSADMVKLTSLNPPTVSRLVKGHIEDEKLVEKVGMDDSSGGKPPAIEKFKGDTSCIIGIDLGATTTQGVLSDLNGDFVEGIDIPVRLSYGSDVIINDVIDMIRELATCRKKDANSRIFGVGIAMAGLVELQNRRILQASARELDIHPVAFGKNATLMVAFTLVLNRMLNLEYDPG